MSDTLPTVTLPELQGALTRPTRGSLSSEMEFGPTGMAIKSLEQGMQLAKYLVDGGAAPKGWTPAQVFLAMQAGLEHNLGYTGGIQSFVIINNMPAWRGQAAAGKIRASRVLQPGTLDFGCEEDPTKKNPDGTSQLRGWCRGQRVGDPKVKTVYFTQQEAVEAGLWGSGNNWTKFRRRMLMWRAVGFLTKDLFSDVLGNFPIAEELLGRDLDDDDALPSRRTIPVLPEAPTGMATDPLLKELTGTTDALPPPLVDPTEAPPAPKPTPKAEGRFRDLLSAMDEAEDLGALEIARDKAHKAAGGFAEWESEAEGKFQSLRSTRFGNVRD